jgi:hypothetical protein
MNYRTQATLHYKQNKLILLTNTHTLYTEIQVQLTSLLVCEGGGVGYASGSHDGWQTTVCNPSLKILLLTILNDVNYFYKQL